MSTITYTMELRGEMVAVTCEVYRTRGEIWFEEEQVIGHPEWELHPKEVEAIQQGALAFFERRGIIA